MQYDEVYKGYRIKYRELTVLGAVIWPPNSTMVLSDVPQATRDEGMGVLKSRTYAAIDAHIEKMANTTS
jgi:hypothetical protein